MKYYLYISSGVIWINDKDVLRLKYRKHFYHYFVYLIYNKKCQNDDIDLESAYIKLSFLSNRHDV